MDLVAYVQETRPASAAGLTRDLVSGIGCVKAVLSLVGQERKFQIVMADKHFQNRIQAFFDKCPNFRAKSLLRTRNEQETKCTNNKCPPRGRQVRDFVPSFAGT
jgi:hypothetical protein